MSHCNTRIKSDIHRADKYYEGDLSNDWQPHCNDRWRALRRSLGLNAQYTICGTGVYSFWGNFYVEDEKHPRGYAVDDILLARRQAYLQRKGLD